MAGHFGSAGKRSAEQTFGVLMASRGGDCGCRNPAVYDDAGRRASSALDLPAEASGAAGANVRYRDHRSIDRVGFH